MSRGLRAAAALVAVLVLAPVALPVVSAGVTTTFTEGDSVAVVANDAASVATVSLPNPARAVDASLDVMSEPSVVSRNLPPPAQAWWNTCPTGGLLDWNVSHFVHPQDRLPPSEVAKISTTDAVNFSVLDNLGLLTCLTIDFSVDAVLQEAPGPVLSLELMIVARVPLTNASLPPDLQGALYEQPAAGHGAWRPLSIQRQGATPGDYKATVDRPLTVLNGSSQVYRVVLLPSPTASDRFDLDSAAAMVWVSVDPTNPAVSVRATNETVWSFRSPSGGPAPFGRTISDVGGGVTAAVASNGTVAEGLTGQLYVPAGATVDRAYVSLQPDPYVDLRFGQSQGALYGPYLGGATPADQMPVIDGIPINAQPLRATVTLYNLTNRGLPSETQLVVSTVQSVGNLSGGFERAAAQTVNITSGGLIEAVELNLANATGHLVGPLVLEVRDLSGNAPGNTTIATGIADPAAARRGGWVMFSLTPGVQAAPGEKLALVLSSPGAADNEYWEWRGHNGVSVDPYTKGEAFVGANASGNGPWVAQTNVDMAFRLLETRPDNDWAFSSLDIIGSVFGSYEALLNYSGNATGHRFDVEPTVVSLVPDGLGGGSWAVQFVNVGPYNITFACDVALEYELHPRAVEVAVGNASAARLLPVLSAPTAVDLGPALSAALAEGNYTSLDYNGTTLWLFQFRVRADGPAGVVFAGYDIGYQASLRLTGLAPALNRALALVDQFAPLAEVLFEARADTAGSLRLANLNILFSERPLTPPTPAPVVQVPEGAQNATVADVYQWFFDDLDGFRLNYTIVATAPSTLSAQVFAMAIDGNLTVSLPDTEYAGPASVTVRATDSTGLWAERTFAITVLAVPDPPAISPIPEIALANTTGTFNLGPYIVDNDTAPSGLTSGTTSVFARLNGTLLTLDYRTAPASLLWENVTIWVNDGTSNVTAVVRVAINNAGRPLITTPSPIPATERHNLTLLLDAYVADDRDGDDALKWGFLRVVGVGAIPGDGTARLDAATRRLVFFGTAIGDVEVGLTVEDSDGNLAAGVLLLRVTADLPPSLGALDGLTRTIAAGETALVNISEYLVDADDAMANFTFSVAWNNGSIVDADVRGGVLIIHSLGAAGRANVTVVATDPAGQSATATVTVVVEGAGAGAASLVLPALGIAVAGGIGAYLMLARRSGRQRRASLGKLQREDAQVEADEDAGARLAGPEGLERTDEERMLGEIEEMEKAAAAPRHALPAVTLVEAPAAPAASELVLAYRDGRPIAWVKTAPPSDSDTQRAQEVAAVLEKRSKAVRLGGRVEGESITVEGKVYLVEARSQLMLAALMEPGANAVALRMKMRAALDAVFDKNAGPLKRWDGSPRALKGVDGSLEPVFRMG